MINVLVNGCNGRMGQEVIKQIDSYPDLVFIGGLDRENTGVYTFPIYTDINTIPKDVNVIIDFSVPKATLNILPYASKNNIPMVIATTGFSKEEESKILEYSNTIPIFKSANMSFDINLMSKILYELAPLLKDTDIEITETHHNRKIDSPSGTALLLANSINSSLGNKMNYVYDRHNKSEKRKKDEIGFSSIRGGNIVGEHTVQFFGEHETFEIKHTTYSRSVFADGAIKATQFIADKPAGFYNMNDLIG